jgi:outer membrane protein TolC
MGMQSARLRLAWIASLLLAIPAGAVHAATTSEVNLTQAVHQSLDSNLDLIARHHALEAARQQIGLARSELLPQIGLGARAQVLESDRSDAARGNNTQESLLLAAQLSQVLYDEESWAGLGIEKYVYDGQVHQLETFRIDLIRDAATAFLELDLALRLVAIQQENRELSRRNRETSRSRIAAGWSSDREILRWDVQLASNDADVRAAQVRALQSSFELNRLRNRPPEDPTPIASATIDEYGFVYAREKLAARLGDPETDRRMRDFWVRVGIRRSPELAALDSSISAVERQLTSNRRAFWVPTLTFGAGVDHLATENNSSSDLETTEYYLKGVLTFPLVKGGAKIAGLEQAREALSGLRIERRATAQSLEQSIRAALAQASGSFETVGFARREATAARSNFDLVEASYTLGVDSILDLLDAQAQLLTAELSLANATYTFLQDVVAAQRELNFFAFLEHASALDSLLVELEREIPAKP